MATPVKIIPTLHGEAARAFIERAEERERNPRNIVIQVSRVMETRTHKALKGHQDYRQGCKPL